MVLTHRKSSGPPQGDFFAFYGAYAEVKGDEKWVKYNITSFLRDALIFKCKFKLNFDKSVIG